MPPAYNIFKCSMLCGCQLKFVLFIFCAEDAANSANDTQQTRSPSSLKGEMTGRNGDTKHRSTSESLARKGKLWLGHAVCIQENSMLLFFFFLCQKVAVYVRSNLQLYRRGGYISLVAQLQALVDNAASILADPRIFLVKEGVLSTRLELRNYTDCVSGCPHRADGMSLISG